MKKQLKANKRKQENSPPGPEPARLKIDAGWQDAVSRTLNAEKPDEGWPDKPDGCEGEEDQKQD